jgi:hypothetical protein
VNAPEVITRNSFSASVMRLSRENLYMYLIKLLFFMQLRFTVRHARGERSCKNSRKGSVRGELAALSGVEGSNHEWTAIEERNG